MNITSLSHMNPLSSQTPSIRILLAVIAAVAVLSACSTPRTKPATVVDRSQAGSASSVANVPTPPGYYRVKRGDTVLRIALDQGQSYRDIVRWNNLTDPNLIEVDQLLLVRPPAGKMTVKPLTAATPPAEKMADQRMAEPAADPKIEAVKPDVPAPGIRLSWPAKGKVVEDFVDGKSKGIDIAGKLGDPIQAASDGRVVYAGNSLRGYGNLVIVKHDNTYLTAYAHNRNLLVKEGDSVRKGQKIAEMGDTDANSVRLHFELRVNGKPVDPLPFLQ
jgi:lipoprotein NlpD